jgi:WD40 repeat protein
MWHELALCHYVDDSIDWQKDDSQRNQAMKGPRMFRLCALMILSVVLTLFAVAPPVVPVDWQGDALPPGALARIGSTRLLHPGIMEAAIRPDGKIVATVATGLTRANLQEVRFWDVKTGKLVSTLKPQRGEFLQRLLWLPDGSLVALSSIGIRLYENPLTGKAREIVKIEDHSVTSISADPTAKKLAVGCDDGAIVIVNIADGKILATCTDPTLNQVALNLAWSPDGRKIVSVHGEGQVAVWDASNAKLMLTHAAQMDNPAMDVVVCPENKRIISNHAMGVRVLDINAAREMPGFTPPEGRVLAFSFPKDSKQILGLSDKGSIVEIDPASGRKVERAPGLSMAEGRYHMGRFGPGGTLAAVMDQNRLILIDVKTGKSLHDSEIPSFVPGLQRVGWLKAEEIVVTSPTSLVAYDAKTGKKSTRPEQKFGSEMSLPLTLDLVRNRGLWMEDDQNLIMRSLSDDKVLWKIALEDMRLVSSAFSRCGKFFAGVHDRGIDIRLSENGKLNRSITLTSTLADHVLWSPTGRSLVLLQPESGAILFVEVATGKVRQQWEHEGAIDAVFSPDGRRFAVASDNGAVAVYQLGKAKPIFEVLTQPHGDSGLAFSPDGKLLACVNQNEVRIWDEQGRGLGVFRGHYGLVHDIAFAPDGKRLVSLSEDGTGLIWDVEWLRRAQGGSSEVESFESLWNSLIADDARVAFAAEQQLLRQGDVSVKWLSKKLVPTPRVDEKVVADLLAKLDGDDAETRREAAKKLEEFDVRIQQALQKAHDDKPSAEVKRALRKLLDRLESAPVTAENLREVRVIEVLENIGTPLAKKLLEQLATGGDSRLTREAKTAISR